VPQTTAKEAARRPRDGRPCALDGATRADDEIMEAAIAAAAFRCDDVLAAALLMGGCGAPRSLAAEPIYLWRRNLTIMPGRTGATAGAPRGGTRYRWPTTLSSEDFVWTPAAELRVSSRWGGNGREIL